MTLFSHNMEEPAHCKQFHWKCCTVLLWDNWVWAESREGYQLSRNSAVPFRALIILIISQQRVRVDDEAVWSFCLSLAKEKWCLLCWKKTKKKLSLLVNLCECLDRENWATMMLLPKAHICSAAQHWAGDFCPSVPRHNPIFKLITMTAIISAGHSGGVICWATQKGKNKSYVFYR